MALLGVKMTAPAEEPVVAGSSVPVREGFYGGIDDPPPSSEGDERDSERAVLGDEEDDLSDENFSSDDDDDDDTTDDDEDINSDSEFEDDDDDEVPKVNNGMVLSALGRFLGEPAWIATVQSTVSFTKIIALSAPPCHCHQCQDGGGGEIIVQYCYTRFLRAQSGGDSGVDMHVLGPKQARLRFVAPSPLASDPVTTATSLRFAGAVLASLVYPVRFSAQLQTLWSSWSFDVRVLPPRTTRLLVTVDAGILRLGDFTPARMRRMCAAMESMAYERTALLPAPVDVGAELRLPALLRSEDDVRPTKRRRVTGEDCPICCEALEEGLAAWPRCSHIFHGGCLEQHLLRGYQECPLCRSELKLSPGGPAPLHVESECMYTGYWHQTS